MELKTAIEIFRKQYKDAKIIGYWDNPEGIILGIKTKRIHREMLIPGQYLVTDKGDVIPTNPMRHDIRLENMKKITG